MRKLWTPFGMSLTLLLSIASFTSSAQFVSVPINAIREANATSKKLESCMATIEIVAEQRNNWIDSTSIQRDSTKVLHIQLTKLTNRRNNWRLISVTIASIILLETLLK